MAFRHRTGSLALRAGFVAPWLAALVSACSGSSFATSAGGDGGSLDASPDVLVGGDSSVGAGGGSAGSSGGQGASGRSGAGGSAHGEPDASVDSPVPTPDAATIDSPIVVSDADDAGPPPCDPTEVPLDGVFVSAIVGAPAASGTSSAPLSTINDGLALAKASGKTTVYVAPGVYTEHIVLVEEYPSGLTIVGGWRVSASLDWNRDCAPGARAKVTITWTGIPATVEVTGVTKQVSFERLSVTTAGSVAALGAPAGSSLVAVVVRDSPLVSFTNVYLGSGVAGDGAPADATPAVSTQDPSCKLQPGSCQSGAVGGNGAAAGSATEGSFLADGSFQPGNGNAGLLAGSGEAGTAGGAGSTLSPCHSGCDGSCSPIDAGSTSSEDGYCGCGGFGGPGGNGGKGGGASVALVAAGASTVVSISESSLLAKGGGAASAGGIGAIGSDGTAGQVGADSGTCSSYTCSWNYGYDPPQCDSYATGSLATGGTAGGTGAKGGTGGDGSPGAGGPSYAVARIGDALTYVSRSSLDHGSGGTGSPAGATGPIYVQP